MSKSLPPPPYISEAAGETIVVKCADTATGLYLEHYGFVVAGDTYTLTLNEKIDKAKILSVLRDNGLCFSTGHEWNPSEVFEDLREKGFVSGKYKEIAWSGTEKWKVREI